MTAGEAPSESALVAAVLSDEPGAAHRFWDFAEQPLWAAVSVLEGAGPAGEAAMGRVLDALRADGWARLARFDGRARLRVFLSLTARDILIAELPGDLAVAPRQAWPRFIRYFHKAISQRVARRFPRADIAAREDLYQGVCVALVENDYARLRAFGDIGHFEGYVLRIVDRLLLDELRKETARIRPPAAVNALGALAVAVFTEGAKRGAVLEPSAMWERLRSKFPDLQAEALASAIDLTRPFVTAALVAPRPRMEPLPEGPGDLTDPGATPESFQLAEEREAGFDALVRLLESAVAQCSADEQAYFQIFRSDIPAPPARDIARLMGRPVAEVYQIKSRLMRHLAPLAGAHKNLAMAVLGSEE